LQVAVVRETPFDRRHGVGSLVLDTAGQVYTSGGPHIRNVPKAAALGLARDLAYRASRTRYRS
jgi:hypothetical protein